MRGKVVRRGVVDFGFGFGFGFGVRRSVWVFFRLYVRVLDFVFEDIVNGRVSHAQLDWCFSREI